jgi:RimJ/RimL family protein N-acetyltransferase
LLVIEAEGTIIGAIVLRNTENLPSRSATFGILIGDPAYLDRGYGSEASALLLDYAFAVLGYHKINLDLFEYNARAQAMYERLGFVVEGRRRENHWSRGRFWDEILMGVTAEEWWSKHGSPRLPGTAPAR